MCNFWRVSPASKMSEVGATACYQPFSQYGVQLHSNRTLNQIPRQIPSLGALLNTIKWNPTFLKELPPLLIDKYRWRYFLYSRFMPSIAIENAQNERSGFRTDWFLNREDSSDLPSEFVMRPTCSSDRPSTFANADTSLRKKSALQALASTSKEDFRAPKRRRTSFVHHQQVFTFCPFGPLPSLLLQLGLEIYR